MQHTRAKRTSDAHDDAHGPHSRSARTRRHGLRRGGRGRRPGRPRRRHPAQADRRRTPSVVVVEKGSEVGAHILSGAVIDPSASTASLPDWREEADAPLRSQVTEDRFLLLGPAGGVRLPNFLMPPLMSNHGNYIGSLGEVCALAGRARPRRWASRSIPASPPPRCFTTKRARSRASRPATSASTRTARSKDAFTRGMELRGKYMLFAEGARGSLCQAAHRAAIELDDGREPQKFGIGLKELWRVEPAASPAGRSSSTPSAGRSTTARAAARSSIIMDDGIVVRRLRRASQLREPALCRRSTSSSASRRIRRSRRSSKAASASPTARARSPKAAGRACRSCRSPAARWSAAAAGFVNVPRIKGSHNAILSGMLARRIVRGGARRRAAPTTSLTSYEATWRDTAIGPAT